ncbi:MAG: T9SS type A sorting domain-containing protein [Bacteroidota bacterium]
MRLSSPPKMWFLGALLLLGLWQSSAAQLAMNAGPAPLAPTTFADLVGATGGQAFTPVILNDQPLINLATAKTEVLILDLTIGNTMIPLKLERHKSLLSSDFKMTVLGAGGKSQDITSTAIFEIYRGSTRDAAAVPVSLAISNLGVSLSVDYPGQPMMLLPSFMPLQKAAVNDEYLWMPAPVTSDPSGCLSESFLTQNQPVCPQAQPRYLTTAPVGPCQKTIEIAADADSRYMGDFPDTFIGNFTAGFSLLFTLEAAERVYDLTFNTTIDVTSIRLFRDPSTDPYPEIDVSPQLGSTAQDDLNNAILNVYNAIPQSEIRRDLPLLYTGNTCVSTEPPVAGTLFGWANLNSVCRDNAAAFLTSCIFGPSRWRTVVPHEIGHTIGGRHPNNNMCTGPCGLGPGLNSLLCSGGCPPGDPLFLDAGNVALIDGYMQVFGECLQRSAEILGPEVLCPGQSGEYVLQTNGAQTNLATWSVSSGLTITGPGSATNSVIVQADAGFTGTPFVQAEVDEVGFEGGCDPTYRRRIAVGPPPALCENAQYRICTGAFNGLIIETVPGHTLDNFTCISPNCGALSWNTFGNGNVVFFTVAFGTPGLYDFSYTNTNSCGTETYTFTLNLLDPSDCNLGPKAKTHPTEAHSDLKLQVTPNPNAGQFQLSYHMHEAGPAEITVRDTRGRVVFVLPPSTDATAHLQVRDLDLSGLPTGLYLVNLRTATQQQTVRMAIQN